MVDPKKQQSETSDLVCIYPLTHKQSGKYHLYQLMPKCVNNLMCREVLSFNMFTIAHVSDLNFNALQKSIDTLVRRHESLRTTFLTIDDKAVQYVHPESCTFFDRWTTIRFENTVESTLPVRISEIVNARFDMENGPMFQTHVLKVDVNQFVVILVISHVIADAHALAILEKEISVLYKSFDLNIPIVLRAVKLQMKDYAVWEERFLAQTRDRCIEYWKNEFRDCQTQALKRFYKASRTVRSYSQQLRDELIENFPGITEREVLNLRGSYHRGTSLEAAAFKFSLSKNILDDLVSLSRIANVTLFIATLSVVKLFLLRVTGKKKIAVAYEISNRSAPHFEFLVGWLCNTVFTFANREINGTLLSFLQENQTKHVEISSKYNYPFDQILASLDISLDSLGTTFINFINSDTEGTVHEECFIESASSPYFDIDLLFEHHKNGVNVTFKFRKDLFDINTIGFLKDELVKTFELAVKTGDDDIRAIISPEH
jgi:hypothetical protein